MPPTSKEEKKALLGNLNMIPGPVKSILGPKIKQAEDFVNSLIRYAVLPVRLGNDVALVSLMYASKMPPIKVKPLYDIDDLKIIAYALIKAYNRLKPQANAIDFLNDIFGVDLKQGAKQKVQANEITQSSEAKAEEAQEEPQEEEQEADSSD
jgi:hypothetical protein